MNYTVELTRFKVKAGKSAVVDEWMKFLNSHMEETLLTLENEKMYVETIFRETLDGQEYLYWYSVQGVGGRAVEDSDFEIDKKHLEYWAECIDDEAGFKDLDTQVVMIQKPLIETMEQLDAR
ncbi:MULTISPECIES: DUF6176 family protein [unclassified Streptococcus]|uniref:DUF6176 family protein n=1 Tax=unclassified Streptococcus TaxID=2608887 RepID=UPI001072420C|nr:MULTISPECIES: DUF6176 family protein [unclassified Streptococcus]MBF0787702.1 hypothetical protein [Streptococcus sp. 19428wC2_LYSM12]MCQ9211227.1 DUF6176 family protein [Streptococcus sp. B01]MCQ9214540.1 DUF6176 family protein [Streptococcus sp. O1]TFV05311.1 hypothetical protein E4T79_07310 [Streptococcus sp. LYSM12]